MFRLEVRLVLSVAFVWVVLGSAHSEAGFGLYALGNGYDGGGIISAIDASGNATPFATIAYGLNPESLAVDRSGNVFVSGNGGTIEKFSSTGQDLGAFVAGLSGPTAIAIDSSGNLYASELFNGVIQKFSTTGRDLGAFATGLSNPSNLAFDPSGNLYEANYYGGINKFSSTGQLIGGFAVAPVYGMAVDLNGNVYISQFFFGGESAGPTADILKFSSTGQSLGIFASSGTGLTEPVGGLAFDSSGNLYVANNNQGLSGNIEKFSSTGQDLGNFSTVGAVALAFAPSAVPEPASLVMVGVGLSAALGFARLRGRRSSRSA